VKTVTLGDIEVAYTEAGRGTPVVFVHGLAEDKTTWAVQQRDLGDAHTFAYDLRGHGDTTLGEADATLAQLGRDLVAFLEKVSGPAVVVGFSLGGTVALWAAAERPDVVTRVVVLGTSSVVGRKAADFYARRIAQAADPSSQEFRTALRDDTAAALAVAHHRLDEVVAARLRAIGDGRGYASAARTMASLNGAPLTPRLADVQVPISVVGATGDTFCPAKAAAILTAALPDVTYHEIPNAGHLMNIDDPAAVTSVVRTAIAGRN
jgi:3-oxoadipate enol-lactonase